MSMGCLDNILNNRNMDVSTMNTAYYAVFIVDQSLIGYQFLFGQLKNQRVKNFEHFILYLWVILRLLSVTLFVFYTCWYGGTTFVKCPVLWIAHEGFPWGGWVEIEFLKKSPSQQFGLKSHHGTSDFRVFFLILDSFTFANFAHSAIFDYFAHFDNYSNQYHHR